VAIFPNALRRLENAWIIGFPAAGLVEIADDPLASRGKVLSMDEIEYKDVK
jgi:hypothetical protein